jgi:hypothetical protein
MCSKVRTRNFGGAALLRTNKSLKTPQVSTFGPLLRKYFQYMRSRDEQKTGDLGLRTETLVSGCSLGC